MWREIFNSAWELLRLKERLDSHNTRLDNLEKDLNRLSRTVERLEMKFDGQCEYERQEHEKLVLQLENALLRFDRRLPKESDTPPSLGDGEAD
jgi:predicted  nucleic acid-binding Zn-ribbon protein